MRHASDGSRPCNCGRASSHAGDCAEYAEGIHVYALEDGERHLYAAISTAEAVREHFSLMECEDETMDDQDGISVRRLTPGTTIAVRWDGVPAERDVPAGGTVVMDEDSYSIEATAAQWAEHARSDTGVGQFSAGQISSTVF